MTSATIPGLTPAASAALASPSKPATSLQQKAKNAAQDFEAVFINSMFQQMFSSVSQGPFSGGPAANMWRSFLTDEYAKTFAKSGGIGIAEHVQRALLARQEIQ